MKLKKTHGSFYLILLIVIFFTGCNNRHHISPPAINNENLLSDIIYGSNNDWKGNVTSLKMDIYMPAHLVKGKKYPLVLFMHGGGFLGGDKASGGNKCSMLADSGFIAASINYRVGWDKGSAPCMGNVAELEEAGYRSIQDANAALRFLISKADEYSIDTNWLFLSGSSAGAIATLCSVYFDDNNIKNYYPSTAAKLGSLKKADNNLTNIFTIKGICSISGALPDSNLINASVAVPTIFFHGQNDETIPVGAGYYASCNSYPSIYGSLTLSRRLNTLKITTAVHIFLNAGHAGDQENKDADEFKMSNAAAFFHSIMKKKNP